MRCAEDAVGVRGDDMVGGTRNMVSDGHRGNEISFSELYPQPPSSEYSLRAHLRIINKVVICIEVDMSGVVGSVLASAGQSAFVDATTRYPP